MRLGILHVERDILQGLTAKQFRAWEHYVELEPFRFFTELRADHHAASIAQMIANVNRSSKSAPMKLHDFVLKFEKEREDDKPTQTPKQQFAMLKLLAAMHAGDPDPKVLNDGPGVVDEVGLQLLKAREG